MGKIGLKDFFSTFINVIYVVVSIFFIGLFLTATIEDFDLILKIVIYVLFIILLLIPFILEGISKRINNTKLLYIEKVLKLLLVIFMILFFFFVTWPTVKNKISNTDCVWESSSESRTDTIKPCN